jgi:hypothetical protein
VAKKKTDDALRVLIVLRSALTTASRALSDSYSLASDAVVSVTDDVETAEKAVDRALRALENHWPTLDPSGRCQGCERCRTRGVN